MTEYAIDIVNVTKRYAEHTAVRDLTLRVPTGSVYGLLGPNGAGKTTTIRMILNIIAPDSGMIHIFGRPSNDPKITERLGYLPEERGLYRKMQVRRVLKFLAELKGVKGKDADRPDLVILDEPFSGLDPINAQALKDTVVELKKRGKTVIFSTHLMDNAERLCDSVCIIARGEKVLDGTVTGVKEEHGQRNIALALDGDGMAGIASILRDSSLVKRADDSNRFFEIELAPGADPQVLLRRIVESGAAVQRFEMIQPSLLEIFLKKVGASVREPGAEAWSGGVEEGMAGHG